MARSEAERRSTVGESVLRPSLMRLSVDVAKVESIVESAMRTCELQDTAALRIAVAVARTTFAAVKGGPACGQCSSLGEIG